MAHAPRVKEVRFESMAGCVPISLPCIALHVAESGFFPRDPEAESPRMRAPLSSWFLAGLIACPWLLMGQGAAEKQTSDENKAGGDSSGPFSSEQQKGARARPAASVAEIAKLVRPSLVKVIQTGREGMEGLGAGFVVSADGLIATNKHVIGEARRIEVEFDDGRRQPVIEVTANDQHLDLAVLRIAQKDLKPLKLGDSDQLAQGDEVVAMGNPDGLDFSVVSGVISEPKREIEGREMIQIAVPIERGNSGGPLLNHKGEVLGLLTLKSQRTENLGFAMPVSALKTLIEKPNPIPMSRWLTIGVLDPKLWKPLLGGAWTQRAGIVKASDLGHGFGGRTLCLWVADEPETPFEAQVTVRLEDESGAAGLVFCSDGGDRHYGFYPTTGKLRLTRFDGPDVYSWTVLAELESDAYRPGDWNQLRVRVEGGFIQCFVNGRRILEQEDTGLRGGKAGLCKFRAPGAEFKAFRVGADLAERHIEPAVAERLQGALKGFVEKSASKGETVESLLAEGGAGRRMLVEQRKALEASVASLRDLERELHRSAITRELVKQLSRKEEEIDLLRCALLISRHDNPDVEIDLYLRMFQRMVDELRSDAVVQKGGANAVRRLVQYLFEENGFHGSRHDYDNRSNSYINEVLDDREGLPITLSVVLLELASKLGVKDLFGLALPGRFMVGFRETAGGPVSAVDVFEGGAIRDRAGVEAALSEDGIAAELPDAYFEPAKKMSIVTRMIANLRGDALESPTSAKQALPYLNLLIALDPADLRSRLMRGKAREISGDRPGAREDVSWLKENPPPDLPDEQRIFLDRWLQSLRE